MTKGPRLSRVGVLAPAALSAFIDASVLAAPAAGAVLSTVLKELSKAFMLKKWFHGVMSASAAELLLMDKGKNGSYLVRESQKRPGEYVLSVRVRGRVCHVMIRRKNNKYNVGSGEDFDDLSGLIEHCRAYPLIESSGDVLRLMQPVSEPRASSRPLDIVRSNAINAPERGHFDVGDDLDDSEGQEDNFSPVSDTSISANTADKKFEDDYNSLRVLDARNQFTKFEANRYQNAYKNRFRNVLPYDQTRVVLPQSSTRPDTECSDYINASYINPSPLYVEPKVNKTKKKPAELLDVAQALDVSEPEVNELTQMVGNIQMEPTEPNKTKVYGIVEDKHYIATQGCLWTSFHAFWQMVVHNDVRVIAMLTDRVERGKRKCEKYWPDERTTRSYGDVQVSNDLELENVFYIFRKFKVTPKVAIGLVKKDTPRTVYHFQFKGWDDHSVPSDTESILRYIEDVNERMHLVSQGYGGAVPKKNIILAHCSAGIGRTGTYIALDMIMDKIKKEGIDAPVDILSIVKTCRYQRAGMVQNLAQYKFLYLALDDFIAATKNAQNHGNGQGAVGFQ